MKQTEARKPRGPCKATDPDADTVARVLDGLAASRELDDKYRSGLLEHAASSLRDRVRAKDVVQDTFVDAFNKISTFLGRSTFFTWLYGIYKYRLLKEHKAVADRDRREVATDDEAGGPSDRSHDPEWTRARREDEWLSEIEHAATVGRQHAPAADHEVRDRFLAVVSDIQAFLPATTREVFYMRLAGLENGEIARVLHVSDADVRGHVMRGRKTLKEKRDQRDRA